MKSIKSTSTILTICIAFILSACSESTGPENSGRITMQAKLSQDLVSATLLDTKGANPLGAEVDSLAVSRVRILITELKLHEQKGNDTIDNDDDNRVVKTGPILIDADDDSIRVFASEEIPAGTYDKVKFEFHRFSGSEAGQYTDDPIFGDFVKDDRWSIIIDGESYEGGEATPFTYRSDITANLSLKFPDQIVIEEGSTATVEIEIDPIAVFKQGNGVLNPADGSNESKIDNAIKSAIKALKK